jgi:hypothetical protein
MAGSTIVAKGTHIYPKTRPPPAVEKERVMSLRCACGSRITAKVTPGATLTCPGCGRKLTVRHSAQHAAAPAPAPAAASTAFDFAPAAGPVVRAPDRARSSGLGMLVAVMVALVLLGGGGAVVAVLALGLGKEPATAGGAPPASTVAEAPRKFQPADSTTAAVPKTKSATDRQAAAALPGTKKESAPVTVIPAAIEQLATKPQDAEKARPADPPPVPAKGKKLQPGENVIPDFGLEIAPRGKDYALIVPLEIVDVEAASLYHRVRRLKLPDTNRPKHLRLAVTPKHCDDMGSLLDTLGDGFRYTNIDKKALKSLEKLRQFDVVFLTCSYDESWGSETSDVLREYVTGGGTLYASDLRYSLVIAAFPEFASNDRVVPGVQQRLDATVTDPELKRHLGHGILPLRFDMDAWQPAYFDRAKCFTYLEGTYRTSDGTSHQAPLLIKFRYGAGAVVFTSFHNAKQTSTLERKLLEYLVRSVVNARAEAVVSALIAEAGFSPRDLQSMQVSAKQAVPTQTFQHAAKGSLQIGVGFQDLGAKLRLTLIAPDGKKIEHADTATFLIEVPDAAAGTWRYQVAADALPFANFPFVLAVGKSR